MQNYVLRIKNITKEYYLYNSELDRVKESFNPFRKKYHKSFFALKDVNIDIAKGEKVGIIGANGAGKSTLLKIITDVLNPTSGEVEVNGNIAALLELGAGFNQNYTGIENIRLNGTLMGLTDAQINDRMQKIVDFADIGEFIDQPVKSYSSGMFVRLAFATQIFSEPDILIVDEALSVGDIRFQQKCYRAMQEIMKDKTVLLVTHDTAAVTKFCKRVIWINKGQVMYDGDVIGGLDKYQNFIINQAIKSTDTSEFISNNEHKKVKKMDQDCSVIPEVNKSIVPKGDGNAEILRCALYDENGRELDIVEPGTSVKFTSLISFKRKAERPLYGININDRLGNMIFTINSEMIGANLPNGEGEMLYEMSFRVPELNKGEYTITVAVANGYQAEHVQMCWLDDVWVFRVAPRKHDLPGFLYLSEGNIEVSEQ